MKKRNLSEYVIPVSVIACSVVLLGALAMAITGYNVGGSDRSIEIDFKDITGIKLHSDVRYAGAPAGAVTGIRYLDEREQSVSPNPSARVRVTIQIYEGVPAIPSDIEAAVEAETMLGEKLILLSGGSFDAPPLNDGAIIAGTGSSSIDDLARSAKAAIDNVNDIIIQLKSDYPELVPKMAEILEKGSSLAGNADGAITELRGHMTNVVQTVTDLKPRLNGILDQASNLVTNADGAITNVHEVTTNFKADYQDIMKGVKEVVENANAAMAKGSEVLDKADHLIGENNEDIQQLIREMRVVSQNLKVISTYAKATFATLGEKPSRIIWGSKSKDLPSEAEILASTNPVPIEANE